MDLTENLQLKKPAQDDFYNVDDFNANADIIDGAINDLRLTKADLDDDGYVLESQIRSGGDKVFYVDASVTESGDGTEGSPFKTIQEAVNAGANGARVVYINIKAGTYNENISIPRSPSTTWRLSRYLDGFVTVNGKILVDNCNYFYINNILFNNSEAGTYTIQLANVATGYVANANITGGENVSGVYFSNSRGIVTNTSINDCAYAVKATGGSFVEATLLGGSNNIVGFYSSGSVINSDGNRPSATTPFETPNGGVVNVKDGASSYPSNFTVLKNLGNFTDANTLRSVLMSEFQNLNTGESLYCRFANNIDGSFGILGSGHRYEIEIIHAGDDNGGQGVIYFKAHHGISLSYMQIENGVFKTNTPIPIGGGIPLGHIFPHPFPTPPEGAIIVNGTTINRATYAELYAYVTEKGWVKTEAEWQEIASANNGYCAWYSDGDGSTTFRLPKLAPFIQIGENAGTYHEAGLPNIVGDTKLENINTIAPTGAFSVSNNTMSVQGNEAAVTGKSIIFDASHSNDTYGKSNTNQPESHEWILCVQAFSGMVNEGLIDVTALANEVNAKLPLAGGTMTNTPAMFRSVDNDELSIHGGTAKANGAGLWLYGKDKDSLPGSFRLRATSNGENVDLIGHANGRLLWNGNSVAHLAMPSDSYVDLTFGASGTNYTAPADGYFKAAIRANTVGQNVELYNPVNGFGANRHAVAVNNLMSLYIPVKKGQTIMLSYGVTGTTDRGIIFVYAEGAKS